MKPRFSPATIAVCSCFLLAGVQAQQAMPATRAGQVIPPTSEPVPTPVAAHLNRNFVGTWTGTVETVRQDAGKSGSPGQDSRVRRSVLLAMRASPDGRAINLNITTFDADPPSTAPAGDPGAEPSTIVRDILAFTGETAILTGTSRAQNQEYTVAGLEAFRTSGFGTLVLTEIGQSAGTADEERRMTLMLEPGTFVWLEQSRRAGSEDAFRLVRQYRFTRDADAAVGR